LLQKKLKPRGRKTLTEKKTAAVTAPDEEKKSKPILIFILSGKIDLDTVVR